MEKLKEKYTTLEKLDKDKEKEINKTILSNEAFAICEFIEGLINKIERTRTSTMIK